MRPVVTTISIKATPPSLQDNTGDLDRLKKKIQAQLNGAAGLRIPFQRLGMVAGSFRQAGFTGVAVINDGGYGPELVDFLAHEPTTLPAMALDLGTTHLEARLIDLKSGGILAQSSLVNSQIQYGADILSRIHFAATGDGRRRLHADIIEDVNNLSRRLAEEAAIQPEEIRAVSVAGNTAMTHFFLNLDPYHLCREPYIPKVNSIDPFPAEALALAIHPSAPVLVFPNVGSYFGGDLIAGILASGMADSEKISMLIDVGTNAEVVLGNRDWLIACAGAAGPALEGGVARMGMRADSGVIEHVRVAATGEIVYKTIGDALPMGICGSGIIDLVAGLYLAEMIDFRGKFNIKSGKGRFVTDDSGDQLVVVPALEAAGGIPVLLGQVDLDALMRSKAAMYAILTTVTKQVGVAFEELEHIYVAGAFGQHIDPRQAIVLGMLPDLPLDRYVPVGNSSLAGAQKILLDLGAAGACREITRKITYSELNVNQEFMMRFSGSRFIPHTDHSLFPSVPIYNDG